MKKILLLVVMAVSLSLGACSKDDGDSEKTENIQIELKTGEMLLPFKESIFDEIVVENDFIAEISSEGKVKGMHKGSTKAVVRSEGMTYDCEIKVAANYTLYIDLDIYFGMSRENLELIYGEPTRSSKETYYYKGLLFKTANAFTYKNDKVIMAATGFSASYAYSIGKHLACRYELYATNSTSMLFGDSHKLEDAHIVVLVETSASGVSIVYAKASDMNLTRNTDNIPNMPIFRW